MPTKVKSNVIEVGLSSSIEITLENYITNNLNIPISLFQGSESISSVIPTAINWIISRNKEGIIEIPSNATYDTVLIKVSKDNTHVFTNNFIMKSDYYPTTQPRIYTNENWKIGDTVLNTDIASVGCIGWICTEEGTPGVWKQFGIVSQWQSVVEKLSSLPVASKLYEGRHVLIYDTNKNYDVDYLCVMTSSSTYEWVTTGRSTFELLSNAEYTTAKESSTFDSSKIYYITDTRRIYYGSLLMCSDYVVDVVISNQIIKFMKADGSNKSIGFGDINYVSKTINTNSSSSVATAASTNTNTFINHIENNKVTSSHKIIGSGCTTVQSDSDGNLTIHSEAGSEPDDTYISNFTLSAGTWSTSTTTINGNNYYTYVISDLSSISEYPLVNINSSGTIPTDDEEIEFNKIDAIVSDPTNHSITFYALNKPTADIMITIKGSVIYDTYVSTQLISASSWSSSTTEINSIKYYTYQLTSLDILTNYPLISLGSTNYIPTLSEELAYSLIEYITADSTNNILTLYSRSKPSTDFYLLVSQGKL